MIRVRTVGPAVLAASACLATLTVPAAAQPLPPPVAIAIGETLTGTLDKTDLLLPDTSYYECFVLVGAPGVMATITMRSAVFDAFLLAVSSTAEHCDNADAEGLVQDDDGGGGLNGTDAQLVLTFDANGRFLIAANSYGAGATGEYTLTVEGNVGATAPPKVPPPPPDLPAAPPPPGK